MPITGESRFFYFPEKNIFWRGFSRGGLARNTEIEVQDPFPKQDYQSKTGSKKPCFTRKKTGLISVFHMAAAAAANSFVTSLADATGKPKTVFLKRVGTNWRMYEKVDWIYVMWIGGPAGNGTETDRRGL